jgi:hypothetical protein
MFVSEILTNRTISGARSQILLMPFQGPTPRAEGKSVGRSLEVFLMSIWNYHEISVHSAVFLLFRFDKRSGIGKNQRAHLPGINS